MTATHIANPVRVKAIRILEVTDITNRAPGCGQTSPDLMLRLEDGTNCAISADMTARYVPVVGDYMVWQEDGYTYVNPKDVFERKYRALPLAVTLSGLESHQKRVVEEKAALDDLIQRLAAFIDTFDKGFSVFASLPEPERMRLYGQHRAMTAYSTILGERIAAFGSQA